MEMTRADYKSDILEVEAFQSQWRNKCRRNLAIYEWTRNVDLMTEDDNQTVGYYGSQDTSPETDHTTMIQENIIRSVIDTLSSKIASQKVLPFINTINGTYKEMQIVKAAQQFFDIMYDELDVNKTVVRAFTDACITDRGIIYIDKDLHKITRIEPWRFFFDPREYAYGKMTKCSVKYTDYPTSLLDFKTNLKTVTMHEYWNINEHVHVKYFEELNKTLRETYEPDILPFVMMRWSNPIKSSSSSSVVDLLFGIQKQINYILSQIRDASQSAFGNKYFVPSDSNVRIDTLNNRNGEIIEYDPQMTQQGAIPIQIVATPFMDKQWFEALVQFKQDAYEIVGLSQLSATSQKPSGLDSGVALQTMEDIESDRFECQMNDVIRAYVDIAKVCMKIFNPNDNILPDNRYRGNYKWSDIVSLQNSMSINFSSMAKISKDPATKLKVINEWVMNGWITRAHAAQLMEIPDAENGYNLLNNSINAVYTVIDNCINRDLIDVPIFIDDNLLKEEIVSTCLSLTSSGLEKNRADIHKLLDLYKYVETRNANAITDTEYAVMQQMQEQLQQAMPQLIEQGTQEAQAALEQMTENLRANNMLESINEEKSKTELKEAERQLRDVSRRLLRIVA